MTQMDGNDPETATPIFLVGSERSGSTLLRLMLDHHPQIAFCADSDFLVAQVSDAGEFPDVTLYRRTLADNREFRHGGFVIDERLDFPSLINGFLLQKRQRDGKELVGATLHLPFPKLRYVWPRAKYIYLYRDGRDVASSIVQAGWAGNIHVAANWWLSAEHDWALLRSTLDEDRWVEVRYEELTAHPEAQLRRICEFVGVGYSDRMFDYIKDSTYTWPDPTSNFRWRKNMPAKERRLLEARIGPQLAARGYDLSCDSRQKIGAARERWIRLQSRMGAFWFRVSAYGVWLVAAELISRRLGWDRMHGIARRAVDEIIDRNLK